ncbi:MAG: ABC transporter permease [Coriobacteriales bacterium]|jgi:putative ABC transport system permease protein|nr:ABC transporter permease [Coriobacteriales bacterium]
MILLKKMGRDLLRNKAQFISVFLLALLAVGFYGGITAEYRGIELSANHFFAESNLADAWVYGESLDEDDRDAVLAIDGVKDAELLLLYPTTAELEGSPDLTVRFLEEDSVNRPTLASGDELDLTREAVWIDVRFAEARGLAAGDELAFAVEGMTLTLPIAGIVYSPDLVFPELGDSLTPDYAVHGYAFTGYNNLRQLAADAAWDKGDGTNRPIFRMSPDIEYGTRKWDDSYRPLCPTYNQIVLSAPSLREDPRQLLEELEAALAGRADTIVPRADYASADDIYSEVEQHALYARVFPVLLVLIALLTMLSTMNRLVRQQATLVGTMKALGVGQGPIVAHYIGYGFIITLAGGIIGSLLGPPLVPELFAPSMRRFYTLPQWFSYSEPSFYLLPLLVASACALTSWLSCRRVLIQKPAQAMRPQPPRTARHSFLDALPLWRRLGASFHLAERDIRRNRLRSAMSVIGALGTTLLAMVAFTSWCSLEETVEWQYGRISAFQTRASLEQGITPERRAELSEAYDAVELMEAAIEVRRSYDAAGAKFTGTLQVFEQNELLHLTTPDGSRCAIADGQTYVSYSLCRELGLAAGDDIQWHLYGNSTWHDARVDVINRNPLVQGITLTPATLAASGEDFTANVLLSADTLAVEEDGIAAVVSAEEVTSGMDLFLDVLMVLCSVMLGGALLVGLFVTYNLSALAFSEMERELASLKVFGFRNIQIAGMLFIQNLSLSCLGLIPGIFAGWWFADLTFQTEGAQFDLPIFLYPLAVAATAAFVLALSVLVSALFIRKVARLDMVVSLKSPE